MSKRHPFGPAAFFSSQGRIGTIRFLAVVIAITAFLWIIAWGLATRDSATFPLLGALGGGALAKLFAEAGRRRHDTGSSAPLGAMVLVGTILALLSILSLLVDGVAAIAIGAVATAAFAFTFFRPGQTTANAFGKPPSGPLRSGRPDAMHPDRFSLIAATVSIVGCAALGLAVQTTTDRIRVERERRADLSVLQPPAPSAAKMTEA